MHSKDGRPPGPELSGGQWWQSSFGPQSPGVVQPLAPSQDPGAKPCEGTAPTIKRTGLWDHTELISSPDLASYKLFVLGKAA